MGCEEEAQKLREAMAPAKAARIDCEAMTDNAITDSKGSLWECVGEIGGGMIGGALLGGLAGAGVGGIAGGTVCLKGLTDSQKEARNAQACWDKYELELKKAQDEFDAWIQCLIGEYL